MSSAEGITSKASIGEELLSNYLCYHGSSVWKFDINDLRSRCHGETVGITTQVEEMSTNSTSKA